MEEPYFKQHLLVDDYLAGALTDQELAQFEERLLWDEDLVEEVAIAEALRKGLRDSELGTTEGAENAGRAPWRPGHWPPRFAVAATVLLAVSLTFNVIQGVDTLTGTPNTLIDGRTPQVLQLIAERSAETTEFLVDPDVSVVLTIDPVPGFDEYQISLAATDNSTQPIAVAAGLRAAVAQPLAIGLPGSALPPGDYLLTLAGARSTTADYQRVSEVRFQVGVRP